MAQRPTPEQTAARHRAKLAQHEFVPVPGSSLCGRRIAHGDAMDLTIALAGAMTGYDPGLPMPTRRCALPRRMHVKEQK